MRSSERHHRLLRHTKLPIHGLLLRQHEGLCRVHGKKRLPTHFPDDFCKGTKLQEVILFEADEKLLLTYLGRVAKLDFSLRDFQMAPDLDDEHWGYEQMENSTSKCCACIFWAVTSVIS